MVHAHRTLVDEVLRPTNVDEKELQSRPRRHSSILSVERPENLCPARKFEFSTNCMDSYFLKIILNSFIFQNKFVMWN